jgi:hypothetical protein
MPKYKLSGIDSGGLTIRQDDLYCATDPADIVAARSLGKAGGFAEVWDGPRSVSIALLQCLEHHHQSSNQAFRDQVLVPQLDARVVNSDL